MTHTLRKSKGYDSNSDKVAVVDFSYPVKEAKEAGK